MEAPKCRLCGSRHWGGCGPSVTLDAHTLKKPDGAPLTAGDLRVGQTYEVQPDYTVKHLAPRGTFDRNAYQREYMRKRRAAAKSRIP